MTRTLRSMAVGLVLALSGQIISVLPASADITEADRAMIEKMLEDYIRANPRWRLLSPSCRMMMVIHLWAIPMPAQ